MTLESKILDDTVSNDNAKFVTKKNTQNNFDAFWSVILLDPYSPGPKGLWKRPKGAT